ncbi:hypothetical protein Q4F19_17265 [Sphingomonas sp. BIUV-7]|uniref:Chemotaxis protein CheZ n=1 Tax=Sphingomonas natans TaxID=3063330 RepID=A0ABT8YCR5_9SPHN|nr:hypothetical protein [Sphingomonas sp. BIUV-7]MDO6416139.1 hypothetical protein [Sphingomonas sp. BIUV-7]
MSEIRGFEACRARLAELLAQADAVRAKKDGDQADKLADALSSFVSESRPDDPGDMAELAAIAKLDLLAEKTQEEMAAIAIGQAVNRVTDHSTELEAIGETLDQQAFGNAKVARRVRLAPVRDLIDRMTETVAAAKVAARSLDAGNPDEAAIQRDILALAERVQALVGAAGEAVGQRAG